MKNGEIQEETSPPRISNRQVKTALAGRDPLINEMF